jgi:hypothetical protein
MVSLKVFQYDFKSYLDAIIIAPVLERVRPLTIGFMSIDRMMFPFFSEVMNYPECLVCEPQRP